MWNVDTGVEVLAHETQYGGFCKFSMLPKSFSNGTCETQTVIAAVTS